MIQATIGRTPDLSLAKTVLKGTVKKKEEKVDRKSGGTTISKSGQR